MTLVNLDNVVVVCNVEVFNKNVEMANFSNVVNLVTFSSVRYSLVVNVVVLETNVVVLITSSVTQMLRISPSLVIHVVVDLWLLEICSNVVVEINSNVVVVVASNVALVIIVAKMVILNVSVLLGNVTVESRTLVLANKLILLSSSSSLRQTVVRYNNSRCSKGRCMILMCKLSQKTE